MGNLKTAVCTVVLFALGLIRFAPGQTPPEPRKPIYHESWIDLNKNGRKDIYEDSQANIDRRIEDLLSQMTLEEKSCQTATLYGYNRVLKDELPTPNWKIKSGKTASQTSMSTSMGGDRVQKAFMQQI